MESNNQPLDKFHYVYYFAEEQLRRLITAHPNQFPMYTRGGKWDFLGDTWTNWCEGFLGGQLWLIYFYKKENFWRETAEHYSRLIEPRKTDSAIHDLGFLFWPTWKPWYDLTGDHAINDVLVEAGRTLASRYNLAGKYLCSFLAPNSLFIDIMMNVGIIFYAAKQTGNLNLQEIATQHCLTTRRHLVRGDGSTVHEGIFDPDTGEFLHQSTQQGWRADSCWARGLSWALYGFTTAYDYTGDVRFLNTACSCADYYLDHVPHHGIPPNDFDEPAPHIPYDSSAAAIAASGLLDLARSSGKDLYRHRALEILEILSSAEFLAHLTPGWEGILKHGIYHQKKGLGLDESVMWGDYFFLEAIWKVLDG